MWPSTVRADSSPLARLESKSREDARGKICAPRGVGRAWSTALSRCRSAARPGIGGPMPIPKRRCLPNMPDGRPPPFRCVSRETCAQDDDSAHADWLACVAGGRDLCGLSAAVGWARRLGVYHAGSNPGVSRRKPAQWRADSLHAGSGAAFGFLLPQGWDPSASSVSRETRPRGTDTPSGPLSAGHHRRVSSPSSTHSSRSRSSDNHASIAARQFP